MENIRKDIKSGQFKNLYLIYGIEEYTKNAVKRMLSDAIVASDDTMNRNTYEGKKINPKEVIDLSETMPFFSERRLIIMENTEYFKSPCDEIIDYLQNVPETTYFIFVEQEVDKRSRMYKLAKSKGYLCECNRLKRDDIMKWILGKLSKDNKKITRDTMDYLIDCLGDDMEKISREIEKLLCYTMERDVITISDINEICIPEITGKIFEMIEAMGNKRKTKALDMYYDLIVNKEAPLKILYMLSRQFNIMLQLRELTDKRMSKNEIESKTGISSYIYGKTMPQVKNFSMQAIRLAMEDCIAVEHDVKLGNISDKVAVEMMIIKFSS